ncbi:MAG: hypothetical protein HQL32_01080 [Planctomycetes bacterium]|nr:hypothetical protein [Planctomycetota bacterium]
MQGTPSGPRICRVCGANLSPLAEFCQTCHLFDQWSMALETSSIPELISNLQEKDLVMMIHFIKRLKDCSRHAPRIKPSKRKSPQEFDFALQEIEKTTRGLELTSIEAVGVLEMVKQSFIEEMFYEEYNPPEDGDLDD